jgi:hypothetical protein
METNPVSETLRFLLKLRALDKVQKPTGSFITEVKCARSCIRLCNIYHYPSSFSFMSHMLALVGGFGGGLEAWNKSSIQINVCIA